MRSAPFRLLLALAALLTAGCEDAFSPRSRPPVTAYGSRFAVDGVQFKVGGYASLETAPVRCFATNVVPMDVYFTVLLGS